MDNFEGIRAHLNTYSLENIAKRSQEYLGRISPTISQIRGFEKEYSSLGLNDIRNKVTDLRSRAKSEGLDKVLPEMFACVSVASQKTLGLEPFPVQLEGGIAINEGKIAEMHTGEGKTLTISLPAALNALEEKGVHVVTSNSYLAKRDTHWMGPIYDALGLKVAVLGNGRDEKGKKLAYIYDPAYDSGDRYFPHLRPISRKEAYLADITYGTSSQFGFDYLDDNTTYSADDLVQRELHYAIVDEVDDVLLDEARTPLIETVQAENDQTGNIHKQIAPVLQDLRQDEDFTVDEQRRTITLTDAGIEKIQKAMEISDLYLPEHSELVPFIDEGLTARTFFEKDRDYIIVDGKIVLIDAGGRPMPDRRLSGGLHQALEVKENVDIKPQTKVKATITLQNYFKMYKKLAGTTGTAATDAEEFEKTYSLDTIQIPTNKPLARKDEEDLVFRSRGAKLRYLIDEIRQGTSAGRPMLIGTIAVSDSENLAGELSTMKISAPVLNAKQLAKEAQIVADAGIPGNLTISTNMAGRGTDIRLGGDPVGKDRAAWEKQYRQALQADGLEVIGFEHNENRRIDNQLRGRSGRQGDPGSSKYLVCADDGILKELDQEKLAALKRKSVQYPSDEPITGKLYEELVQAVKDAQKKKEEIAREIRGKHQEYDQILVHQREHIYNQRRKVVEKEDIKYEILRMLRIEVDRRIRENFPAGKVKGGNINAFVTSLKRVVPVPDDFVKTISSMNIENLSTAVYDAFLHAYEGREKRFGPEVMRQMERALLLNAIDDYWPRHLDAVEQLREGIGLRAAFGFAKPLVEYNREVAEMYTKMINNIESSVVFQVLNAKPV